MNENDNITIEALSLVTFDQLRAELDAKDWMHVKINDLSLRGEDTRYSDSDTLVLRTAYTDHNNANRSFTYKPGITLGLTRDPNGLYDLSGVYVELLWSPKLSWFLVQIHSATLGTLVYRGFTEPHRAKRPNGMSIYISRVGVTV